MYLIGCCESSSSLKINMETFFRRIRSVSIDTQQRYEEEMGGGARRGYPGRKTRIQMFPLFFQQSSSLMTTKILLSAALSACCCSGDGTKQERFSRIFTVCIKYTTTTTRPRPEKKARLFSHHKNKFSFTAHPHGFFLRVYDMRLSFVRLWRKVVFCWLLEARLLAREREREAKWMSKKCVQQSDDGGIS